jgi:hypothetical protein
MLIVLRRLGKHAVIQTILITIVVVDVVECGDNDCVCDSESSAVTLTTARHLLLLLFPFLARFKPNLAAY